MNITLYKTADETNRLNKTLTDAIPLTGTLREECNILKPTIKIQSATNLSGYNYCYVEDFGRYYYITEISVIRTNLWNISLSVDVLMTYATQIKAVPIVAGRSTNQYNAFLNDNRQVVYENVRIQTKNFPKGFSNPTYILTTSGGN